MTLLPGGRFLRPAFSLTDLDRYPQGQAEAARITAACSVEERSGRERIFVTFKGDMHVYEMDRGNSFDGHPIRAYLRLPYNDMGSSNTLKRYHQILVESASREVSHLKVRADYHDSELEGGPLQKFTVRSGNAVWDEGQWTGFDWSARATGAAKARILGRGRNISVVLASEEADEPTHTLTGVTVMFDLRKRIR